jgi:hypothetical protein
MALRRSSKGLELTLTDEDGHTACAQATAALEPAKDAAAADTRPTPTWASWALLFCSIIDRYYGG